MQERTGEYYENREMASSVKRYEAMMNNGIFTYFDVEEFENIVNYYIDRNQLKKAHNACTNALEIHPTSSELKLKNAQLFVGRGIPKEALKWLNKVPEMQTSNHEYHITKGMALVLEGFLDKAEISFDKAIETGSSEDPDEVYISIGDALENSGNFMLAIKYYLLGLEKFPEDEEFLFRLGSCYDRMADFDQSIVYYEKYLDINPFSDNVWYNLGIIYNKAGQFEKSIEAYEFTLALDSNHFDALFNKGNALANAERHLDAIAVYKEYLTIHENSLTAKYYIGECLIQIKEFNQALDYFDEIIRENPEFAEAYYGKALVFEDIDNNELALEAYLKTLSLDKENTDAWFSLGGLYDKMGETQKAIDAFNQTTKFNRFDIEAWYANAEINARMGNIGVSIALLTEALEYMPDFAELIFTLSGYYLLADQLDQGVEWFKIAFDLDSENYKMVYTIYPQAEQMIEIQKIVNNMA